MHRNALVTGGAGFIGSHTADALAERGYSVRVVDCLQPEVHGSTWPSYVCSKGFDLVRADVRDRNTWEKSLDDETDVVFHFAAYQDQRPDFSRFFDTNTTSTALLYETIVRRNLPVKRVVIVSTQFVYGDGAWQTADGRLFYPELRSARDLDAKRWDIMGPENQPAEHLPFQESQAVTPTNSYGLSKYAAEMTALRLGKTYGIPTTVLRYSIVQGPRQSPKNQYSGALRIFTQQALAGQPITVYEDGQQLRDFVNIQDVVSANLAVLRSRKAIFEVFNVGGGRPVKVLDLALAVKAQTQSESPVVIGGYRRTDTRHAVSAIDKLGRLGWRPKFGIDRSIRDYVAWYRADVLENKTTVEPLRARKQGGKK